MPVGGVDSSVTNLHAFCAGNVAIQPLWPGNVNNCQTHNREVFHDLMVGPPFKGPASQSMQIYVDMLTADEFASHADAAFEVLKCLASPGPFFQGLLVRRAAMPSREAMESYGMYRSEPWKTFRENVQYTRNRQILVDHCDIQIAMTQWVERAALGEIPVGEALQEMDKEVSGIIGGDQDT